MLTTSQVFISGTTAGLGSYRKVVRDALIDLRWMPIEQSHFSPDHRSVEDMLRTKIAECDAVVCLIGPMFGAVSTAFGPDGAPRSYTQLEYDIASAMGKRIYLFLAREDAVLDDHTDEPEHDRQAQAAFLMAIRRSPRVYKEFNDHASLKALALLLPEASAHQARKPIKLPSGDGLFVGREALLTNIRDRFLRHAEQARDMGGKKLPVQVLNGTSGIGKTRLAIEYGHRFEDNYSALLFITADSEERLHSDLAGLVGVLYHENAPERNNPHEGAKLASVLRWLAEHPGWLLILDNVDDAATARKVEELLDGLRAGHVIITSRISGWRRGVEPLELGVIEAGEAARYLLEDTRNERIQRPDDDQVARALVKECDGLALVLEQMSAYIKRHRIGFSEYLRYWNEDKPRLLDFGGDASMFHKKSLAHSWTIAMERSEAPLRDLARVLAWFHPDALPSSIFRSQAARDAFTTLHGPAQAVAQVRPEEILMDLADQCFVRRSTEQDQPCVEQHRLMQEVARIHTSTEEKPRFLACAIATLADAIPQGSYRHEHAAAWRWLRPHALTLLAHSRELLPLADRSPKLMQGVSEHLLAQQDPVQGLEVQNELLAWHQEHSGPDHPETLLAHNDLANFLMSMGRLQEAEREVLIALRGREAHFGSASSEAGESLTVLGQLLNAQERYLEAEEVLTQAVGACRMSDGPEHWRTLMAESSLLNTRWHLGPHEAVIEGMRTILERTRRSLPAGHREIMERQFALGEKLWRLGRLEEARALAIDHHTACERHLGKDDKQTIYGLVLVFNIATTFHEQGAPGEAATLYAEVARRFDAREQRVLKDLPRQILHRIFQLSTAGIGDARVVEASWACLSAFDRDLGDDDPQVVGLVRQLADVMERRSDGEAAIRLRRRALEHSRRSLSRGDAAAHMHAIDLNNLAHALRLAGDPAAAEPYQREALALDERVRGADHPKVAHRLMNLSITCLLCDRPEEATKALERAWAIIGAEPDTTACRILALRAAVDWTLGHDGARPLGMLRTMLSHDCANKSAIDVAWDVGYFTDRLKTRVTPEQRSLITECISAMELPLSERLPGRFPALYRIEPLPLSATLD